MIWNTDIFCIYMHVHCITDVWVAWVTVYYQWEQPAV